FPRAHRDQTNTGVRWGGSTMSMATAIWSARVRRLRTTRRRRSDGRRPSFRDGPKDQTSDVRLHIGESLDSGFARSLSSRRALRGPVGARCGMTEAALKALLQTSKLEILA